MKKQIKLKYLIIFIFSFLFSFSLILTREINYDGILPTNFINKFHFNFLFFVKTFFITILVNLILYLFFRLLDKINIKTKLNSISNKKIFIISFICLFITGILFLITFYPGNIMIDTLYILKDPKGTTAQHPIAYIWLITLPFKIFTKLFNNLNVSLFLTCTSQLIIASGIISYVITWFNKTFKNSKLTIILILYFTLLPIITDYNTTLVKDAAFSIEMLCFIPIIYEIIKSKGKWIKNSKNIIISTIFFTISCLLRNNGIYIIFLLLICFIFAYRKYFKQFLSLLIIILFISVIPSFFSEKQLFQEKIGIPLSQIAYIIHTDGNIKKEDKDYLNEIYDYNLYKTNYNPYIIDTIKWDINFNRNYLNNNSNRFIKTWINILPNNFEGYVKSYILSTYGNWSIDKFYETQSNFLGVDGVDTNNPKLFPEIKSEKTFLSFMKPFYKKTSKYLSGGVCFWLLVLISLYVVYKEKYKLLLLAIPLYGTWLSLMIATPFSLAFRYMSPFMYLLPFIIFITIIKTRDKK